MANALTKNVMARIVERLGPEVGYKALPEQVGTEAKPEVQREKRQIQESTLRKIIHKEMSIGSSEGILEKIPQTRCPVETVPVSQNVKSLSQGGVIRLDDLLTALKK